jgi:predicted peptidase
MKQKITLLLMLAATMVKAQNLDVYASDMYDSRSFISKGDTLPYRILFPENFDASKKYPVVVFLHGSGERGSDNQAQLVHGGTLFLKEDIRKDLPAIIVFPQCPADSYWSNVDIQPANSNSTFNFLKGGKPTKAMELLTGMVDELSSLPYTDKKQFYAGGLSMGGMGTFELLRRKPKLFAAAIVICGGDNPENAKKYKKVPLWIFHGAKDDVVAPENSEKVAAALKAMGANVHYTLYPQANHNSWDCAFAEPKLLPWLFSNRKK